MMTLAPNQTYLVGKSMEPCVMNPSWRCVERECSSASECYPYLLSALDDIERTHCHVSETARQDTTNHTLAIIAHIVNVTSTHFERFA
jgi:hypothetical protein